MEAEVQAGKHFSNPLLIEDAAYQNMMNEEEINKEIDKLRKEKEEQLKIE